MKILANDGLDINAVKKLEENNIEVITDHYDKDDLLNVIGDFEIIVIRSATKIDRKIIDAAKNTKLKLIIRAGVGLDNIDVEYAKKKGIEVKNTPNASTNSVAELVLGHMLGLARFIPISKQTLCEGAWNKKKYIGVEIYGKTLGIIGFGRIGRSLANKATALGMNVIFYDKFIKTNEKYQYNSLDQVLNKSDFISIHTPSTGRPLIGEEEFRLMKDNVYIINASRGEVIDEDALIDALNLDKIAGIGLDVYNTEPNPNPEILNHYKVSCTPHIGAATEEAQERIGEEILELVDDFCKKVKYIAS